MLLIEVVFQTLRPILSDKINVLNPDGETVMSLRKKTPEKKMPWDAPPTYEECKVVPTRIIIDSQNIEKDISTTFPSLEVYSQRQLTEYVKYELEIVRSFFIKKVFAVLACHVLLTTGLLALCLHNPILQSWMQTVLTKPSYIVWSSSILPVIICCLMLFLEDVRRKVPINITWLVAFSLWKSFLLAIISTYFETQWILMAMSVMVIVSIILAKFNRFLHYAALTVSLVIVPAIYYGTWFWVLHENQAYATGLLWASVVVPISLTLVLTFIMVVMVNEDESWCMMTPDEYLLGALNFYYYFILGVFITIYYILYGIGYGIKYCIFWDGTWRTDQKYTVY